MNRIILCIGLMAVLQGNLQAQAQDPAMVERVNRLSVYVEELMADKARYQKQITDLQREVDNLREEVKTLKGGASQQDMVSVVATVQELDRKHRKDMELVATQIEQLGKKAAVAPGPSGSSRAPTTKPERGWNHTVEAGHTLSAIAKAYSDQYNIKITADDILKANPGLKAERLQIGQVIFIPEK